MNACMNVNQHHGPSIQVDKDGHQDTSTGTAIVLREPLLVIPVTGPKESGKTTLINAMLGGRYELY